MTALAAAIGLFFSATVASSSVDATRRQLDQDARQQAGRVGYWTESAGELAETIVIVNRSLDPVTNVELWWYAPDANIDPAKHEDVFMAFSTIPPCTRMVFDHRAVDAFLLSRFGIEQGGAPLRAIQFIDSDGQQWLRDPTGLRTAEYEREDGEDLGDAPARQEPAEHCDK
ncbi:hypothetical protein [Streptomyces sp. NBC_00572]|uniref:hypothetical protein n=1 Tax=Streptomyces sp. NBC_00572 TaxID=2903664 RepID=UPI002258027E|nr:hypothetical protein [Streptomyces sp. NBC_00572]MCX4987042.1 hypothetical protein [Streptomyces sp. NBC_00572]